MSRSVVVCGLNYETKGAPPILYAVSTIWWPPPPPLSSSICQYRQRGLDVLNQAISSDDRLKDLVP